MRDDERIAAAGFTGIGNIKMRYWQTVRRVGDFDEVVNGRQAAYKVGPGEWKLSDTRTVYSPARVEGGEKDGRVFTLPTAKALVEKAEELIPEHLRGLADA